MKEKNKKIGATISVFVSLTFFGLSQSVLAEEIIVSPKLVTFAPSVGKISCENGEGKALVSLSNEPLEGGYYEVYGDMINKNNITLNRNVELPSGTYTWKGFTNNGYVVSGVSSGEFTVGKCVTALVPAQTLKGTEPSPVVKKVENTATEKVETLKTDEEKFESAPFSEIATTSLAVIPKEKRSNDMVGGILLLAAIFAFFGFRNKTPKQEEK